MKRVPCPQSQYTCHGRHLWATLLAVQQSISGDLGASRQTLMQRCEASMVGNAVSIAASQQRMQLVRDTALAMAGWWSSADLEDEPCPGGMQPIDRAHNLQSSSSIWRGRRRGADHLQAGVASWWLSAAKETWPRSSGSIHSRRAGLYFLAHRPPPATVTSNGVESSGSRLHAPHRSRGASQAR